MYGPISAFSSVGQNLARPIVARVRVSGSSLKNMITGERKERKGEINEKKVDGLSIQGSDRV